MQTEFEIIEAIHREFETDLVSMISDKSPLLWTNEVGELLHYTPAGKNARDFLTELDYWKLHYPQNNFLTEVQLKNICLKYNLVAGPSMLFTGAIPEKNRREIEKFQLRDADARHHFPHIHNFLVKLQESRASVNLYFPIRGTPVYEIISRFPAFLPLSSVLPVGDGFVLVPKKHDHSEEMWPTYDLYAKITEHGSEWLVYCWEINPPYNLHGQLIINLQRRIQETFSFGRGTRQSVVDLTTVSLFLKEREISRLNKFDLNTSVDKIIVAPGTMFKAHEGATEVQDGYRLRFKASPEMPAAFFNFYLPDPIVLQPVPGGYLVVTKWGAEANIEEVQSPESN